MHVEKPVFFTPAPGEVIRHHHQSMQTKQGRPTRELYEEFEGGFRHDATNPWAKVIHLQHTSTQFTAVVRPVWLVIVACRTERRTTVPAADEDVFAPELLGPEPLGLFVLFSTQVSWRVALCG